MFVAGRAGSALAPLAGHGLLYNLGDVESPLRPVVVRASRSKASCKSLGNVLPLFAARRSIPAQAAELKKNLSGIGSSARTCDKEDTAAALGQAEILGIKDAPRDCPAGSKHITRVRPSSPWREKRRIFAGQCCQKASESVSPVGENSGDIFPNNESWIALIRQPRKFKGKIASFVIQPSPQPGHGK